MEWAKQNDPMYHRSNGLRAGGIGSNSCECTADLRTGVTLQGVALITEDGNATWVALS